MSVFETGDRVKFWTHPHPYTIWEKFSKSVPVIIPLKSSCCAAVNMLEHPEEEVLWLHPIFTIESFTLDATPSKCATQMPRQRLSSRSVHNWLPWLFGTQSHYILQMSIFIPPLVPLGHPLTLVTQWVRLVALSDIHILSYTPRWSLTEGWLRVWWAKK